MKKLVFMLLAILAILTLTACSKEETRDWSGDNNDTTIVELKQGSSISLKEAYSGKAYLLAGREDLKEAKTADFTINGRKVSAVKANTDGDFNLRYKSKTYFSVKETELTDANEVKLETDWKGEILLVLGDE